MEEAHVCPLGADEDDGVTYARTHAGGFFEEVDFFVFLVNVVVTCMYAWRRGRRRRRKRDDDDDDVFHVFETGGRAHVAEK